METRINDVPALHVADSSVAARYFNRVRLALRRLENPIRLAIPGLRSLDMILGDDYWLCVDRSMNDLPVVAWTDFRSGRDHLQAPVTCKVRYFHAYAAAVMKRCLAETERLLDERLGPEPDDDSRVSPLKRRP